MAGQRDTLYGNNPGILDIFMAANQVKYQRGATLVNIAQAGYQRLMNKRIKLYQDLERAGMEHNADGSINISATRAQQENEVESDRKRQEDMLEKIIDGQRNLFGPSYTVTKPATTWDPNLGKFRR